MIRHRTGLFLGALLIAAGAAAASRFAPDAASYGPSLAEAAAPRATLTKVQETRLLVIDEEREQDGWSFDRPGLTLTFAIELPDGATLLELREPESIRAADSAGGDLTKIETGFGGGRDMVDIIREWDKPPSAFTLRLALPKRSATSFDLSARLDVVTFTGTETMTIEPAEDWRPLPASKVGVPDARVRIKHGSGRRENTELTVEPGTLRNAIEEVILISGENEVRSSGAMWTDQTAVFYFEGEIEPGTTARLTFRTGMKTLPLEIELQGQELP